MKVMVFVKATKSSEAGEMPPPEQLTKLFEEMGNYNEQLVKAGILLAGDGLQPSSKGVRVHFSGPNRTVTDGPFAETKELVAGYWLWRVKSLEEAIEWVKRCPNPMMEDSEIEIRPVFEADDFGEAFTPEQREREAAIHAKGLGLEFPRYEDGQEMLIAGHNQSYTMETRSQIPQQWEVFAPHIGKVPGQQGTTSYGVCWNVKNKCDFDYLTGVELKPGAKLPAGFTPVKLAPHRYIVFTHVGPITSFPQTIETIWSKWAPDCGLKLAAAPCVERYTAEFDPQTGGAEIWIALER
ncbi:YCII-related domain protein [Anatilimnocola aggregata]|uniref:YCII-related domain protein n=1 Tax=Anatilimnocola aggregata TaxID=2528021 RepID=A0A517YE95_9BACT|nr:GyrI-like domain-containing protein [Anatilimnocola aggregata]QDU28492.1 YCII-related domain protein [Anatilimnocola aggregata]